jgi:hypothetical protein
MAKPYFVTESYRGEQLGQLYGYFSSEEKAKDYLLERFDYNPCWSYCFSKWNSALALGQSPNDVNFTIHKELNGIATCLIMLGFVVFVPLVFAMIFSGLL